MMELFRIRHGERALSAVALAVIVALNALIITKFFGLFADYDVDSWRIFIRNFHMSGFDPITYAVVTDWDIGYNIIRHPLLPFLMFPLYVLNQGLWALTGANCVQLLIGLLLVACAFYSFIFLHRIMREVIGISRAAATLLTAFFFSFAYILVTIIVPDHFCLSLFLILLTLYVAGHKMRTGSRFTPLQTAVLLTPTAGVTLSNGVIVVLAVLFVNGRKFWKWKTLALSVALPLVLLTVFAFAVNSQVKIPGDQAVGGWIDTTVPQGATLVENFFGESIQLHRRHVLGDVLVNRPVIVEYSWKAQYAVEAIIALLFAAGAWMSRRDKFGQLLLACFAFAVALHLLLGFAINEVYIMAAHWTFVIPLSVAYLMRKRPLAAAVPALLITLYLYAYHGVLLWNYLTWPLVK